MHIVCQSGFCAQEICYLKITKAASHIGKHYAHKLFVFTFSLKTWSDRVILNHIFGLFTGTPLLKKS